MRKPVLSIILLTAMAFLVISCAKENVNEELTDPVADFKIGTEIHPAPCKVSFLNHSTGSRSSVTWDFGDGNTSNESDPQHIYAQGGTYAVKLSVTNSVGVESVTYSTVTIPEQPTTMRITGIQLNEMPENNLSGTPWDADSYPDVFFYILNSNNLPMTMTGCIDNASNASLPQMITSGLPLEFQDFSGTIRAAAYDRDTGADAPDDYIGSQTIVLGNVLPRDGAPYPAMINFSFGSNPLKFNVILEWE